MGEELVSREEAKAALEARRELGVEYEDHVVDALVEKIEKRLAERRPARRQGGAIMPLALGSLGLSIPLIAIAGERAGVAGVALVCLAIVLVNFFAARR
jgi:hypothetical protein